MPKFFDVSSFNEVTEVFGNFYESFSIYFILSLIVGAALFVLQGFALFKMAKKLNINNEWRAFVPIANIAVLGKIADSYSKDEKKPTKYGKLLYVLYIIEIFLAIVFLILILSSLIYLLKNVEVAIENNTALTKDMFSTFIPVIVVYFILLAVAVIYTVFYNIVLWKIYSMFSKKNAVMFLILSILFGFLTPVLLLIISNNNPVFKRTDENSAIFNLEGEM